MRSFNTSMGGGMFVNLLPDGKTCSGLREGSISFSLKSENAFSPQKLPVS